MMKLKNILTFRKLRKKYKNLPECIEFHFEFGKKSPTVGTFMRYILRNFKEDHGYFEVLGVVYLPRYADGELTRSDFSDSVLNQEIESVTAWIGCNMIDYTIKVKEDSKKNE